MLYRRYVWDVFICRHTEENDKTIQWLINKPYMEMLKEMGLFRTDKKNLKRQKTVPD